MIQTAFMILKRATLVLVALVVNATVLRAQTCDSNAFAPDSLQFATDGSINAALKVGNKLFVAGRFSVIGKATGSFIGIDTSSGHPVNQATWPKILGTVYAAIPDGTGGWFVGGQFSQVGDSLRSNLVRINSSGQITSFNPAPDAKVLALALDGNILYIGGTFTAMGASTRNHLAAYNLSANALSAWNPNCSNDVTTIAPDGDTVWIGGTFTSVGANSRNYIAAVDSATGSALSLNLNMSPGSKVNKILIVGNILYVGGSFPAIAAGTRDNLAAINKNTGTVTS